MEQFRSRNFSITSADSQSGSVIKRCRKFVVEPGLENLIVDLTTGFLRRVSDVTDGEVSQGTSLPSDTRRDTIQNSQTLKSVQ